MGTETTYTLEDVKQSHEAVREIAETLEVSPQVKKVMELVLGTALSQLKKIKK